MSLASRINNRPAGLVMNGLVMDVMILPWTSGIPLITVVLSDDSLFTVETV